MPDRELASDLVTLAYQCGVLSWAYTLTAAEVVIQLGEMEKKLRDVSFYKNEVHKLNGVKEAIEQNWSSGRLERKEPLPHAHLVTLGRAIADLTDRVYQKWDNQEIVAVERHPTITNLVKYRAGLKNESQRIMAADTIVCLETGAYRAATVMAWSLTFDHFRRWVFCTKARLAKFNGELTTRNRTPTQKHDPITVYEDFEEHGEAYLLDVAAKAGLFGKTHGRVLTNALSDRNHFAHPTGRLATPASALGYVDGLLENVLLSPHFKYRQSKG